MDEFKTLLTKIAWSYYINNNTQQEIADKLNISRVKVTRYLQKARDLGIVKITVSLDHGYCFEKEELLKNLLNIDVVSVVPSTEKKENAENGIGVAGALRMNQLLTADDVLGVAWGFTLYSVAKNLQPVKEKNGKQIQVVQLMGGLSHSDKINPEEIVKMIATKLNAQGNWMNVPAVVGSKEARDILMNDESVAEVFQKTKECTICMLGLGNLTEASSLYMTGAYSKEDLRVLKEAGAVGDILSRPYDINGNPIKIPLSDRIIAVSLEQIKSIKNRVAIAVGKPKIKTIIGACRGGYINELITDEDTANALIEYLEH
ncbi:MAG: sugar-binding transcriptional regulator [Acetivibrionales bacterium]